MSGDRIHLIAYRDAYHLFQRDRYLIGQLVQLSQNVSVAVVKTLIVDGCCFRRYLSVGLIVLFVSITIGGLVGIVAGYFGGKVDELLMRVSDIFLSIPGLILAMAFSAAVQSRSLQVLVLVISLRNWPSYARMVRGQVLSIRENQYIEAARAVGASVWRIITKHVTPNVVSPIIVQGTLDTGNMRNR